MSATSASADHARAGRVQEDRRAVRRTTETKASFKTTEFIAYVVILIAILIAGAVTKAGIHHGDVFRASQVWLYVTIVTIGYMVSRGLAKAGSRERYTEDR